MSYRPSRGKEDIALKIAEILSNLGVSQRKLSFMAGISNQDLNQAINGKKPFFPAWRKRVSEALEMSEDELFPEYARRGA